MRAQFENKGRKPATVIVVRIAEIYTQCARAPMRAGLWTRDDSNELPSVGDILAEVSEGEEGGAEYDAAWEERATKTMW